MNGITRLINSPSFNNWECHSIRWECPINGSAISLYAWWQEICRKLKYVGICKTWTRITIFGRITSNKIRTHFTKKKLDVSKQWTWTFEFLYVYDTRARPQTDFLQKHLQAMWENLSLRSHLGRICMSWEASGGHLGGIWEALERHLGGIWEAST